MFAHGVIGHWINPSWLTHGAITYVPAISRSSQCSTSGVTKAVVCALLYVGWFMPPLPIELGQ